MHNTVLFSFALGNATHKKTPVGILRGLLYCPADLQENIDFFKMAYYLTSDQLTNQIQVFQRAV